MNSIFRVALVSWIWVGFVVGQGGAASGGEPPPSADAFLSREYGYFLGDLVEASYVVSLPFDERLNLDSLPKSDKTLEGWAEIKGIKVREALEGRRRVYRISVVYQVFRSVGGARSKAFPPVAFSYGPKANPSAHAWSLPATAPVEVSTLTEKGADFKPAITFSWNGSSRETVQWIGVALIFVGACLLTFRLFSKRASRTHSPFATGLRDLSRDKRPAAALLVFRRALNAKAGRAIFSQNLDALFEAFPAARPFEEEVRELVLLSDEVSFNPERRGLDDDLVPMIARLMRNLRRRERWV